MKAIITILILALSSFALSGEIIVDLDRVQLLTPDENDMETRSSQIAVYFDIPDSLDERRIVYAGLAINLDLSNLYDDGSRKIELQAYGITSDWTEADTWNSLADDVDSLSFYTYTFEISDSSRIFMDITNYIKEVAEAGNTNFGLMLIPHKFDQWAFHVNQAVVNRIESNARVRIVFR